MIPVFDERHGVGGHGAFGSGVLRSFAEVVVVESTFAHNHQGTTYNIGHEWWYASVCCVVHEQYAWSCVRLWYNAMRAEPTDSDLKP
jgi:hypothetical protein